MTDATATPEPSPIPSPAPGLKVCRKCDQARPLLAFPGRRNTCSQCIEAAKARTAERKEAVAYSDALGERVIDMRASGMSVAAITKLPSMPTPRQLRAMRRANPDFDAAYLEAETQSAAAHLDRANEVLRKVEDGELPASDGKVLFDGHLKLASTLNPKRYGSHAIDVTSSDDSLRPAVSLMAAFEALLALLPPAPVVDVTPRRDADLLPPPAAAAGDGADGAAGVHGMASAASADDDDRDPYAEPGEDLGPFERTARAA